MKPRIAIVKTDGTNCDQETYYAWQKAKGNPCMVSMYELRNGTKKLSDFDIITIPGGFSYGDDIASGKLFALELLSCLKDQLIEIIEQKKPIIGICNGFQVLVRTGLLPFKTVGTIQATLADNSSGKFECRWVAMRVEKSPCIFTKSLENKEVTFQAAHAEGHFIARESTICQMEENELVVLRYALQGKVTEQYPYNPNGSKFGIAGICDPTGTIFGLMPHPERLVDATQHPNWRSESITPYGLEIFNNAIQYVR